MIAFIVLIALIVFLIVFPISARVAVRVDVLELKVHYIVKLFGFITLDAATIDVCKAGINQTRRNGRQYFISYTPCRTRGYFEGVFGSEITRHSKVKIAKVDARFGDANNPALTAFLGVYIAPVFADNIFKVNAVVKVQTKIITVLNAFVYAFMKYLKAG